MGYAFDEEVEKENPDKLRMYCTTCGETLVGPRPKHLGTMDLTDKEYKLVREHIEKCEPPPKTLRYGHREEKKEKKKKKPRK